MPKDGMPGAVIFDMDGTLADTEPLHAESFTQAFREFGIHVGVEDYRRAVTIQGSSVRDFFIGLGGRESDWEEVKRIKDPLIRNAVAERGRLIPGALELVESLRQAGVRTAIATSARRASLDIVIEHFGLRDYFDAFATKDEVTAEKPDPALFLLAAERLQVDAAECVVIEDSPRGVGGARRAGMRVIAVPNASTADGDFSQATLTVSSLEEVTLEMLRALF